MLVLTQVALLVALAGSCLLVGHAIGAVSRRRGGRLTLSGTLVMGYVTTPLLVGLIAFATRLDVGSSLLVALAVAAAFALLVRVRARTAPDRGVGLVGLASDGIFTAVPPMWIWGVAVLSSLAVAAPYLQWSLGWPAGQGYVHLGTNVFDFEKHMGVTVSLMRYGLPAEHFAAPGVSLTYYIGYYILPACLGRLFPAHVLQALASQWILGGVVFVLVGWEVLCTLIPQERRRWRLPALPLVLFGLSVGLGFLDLAPLVERVPLLRAFYRPRNHPEPIMTVLLWLPQHAVAGFLFTLLLLKLEKNRVTSTSTRVCWTLCAGYAAASSLFMALLAGAAFVLWQGVNACARALRRLSSREKEEDLARLTWLVPAAGGLALLVIPQYWTVLVDFLGGGGHAGNILAGTDNVLHNIGFLATSCGIGVLALACATPRIFNGPRSLVSLGLVAVAASLYASYTSDTLHKALALAQIALPLIAIALVVDLAQRKTRPSRGFVGFWIGALCISAVLSGLYGFNEIAVQWEYTPTLDRVSILMDSGTQFYSLFGRAAAGSGGEMLPRLLVQFGNQRQIRSYEDSARDLGFGITHSEYLYVPLDTVGYGIHKSRQAWTSDTIAALARVAAPVFQNEAGAILRVVLDSTEEDLAEAVAALEATPGRQHVSEEDLAKARWLVDSGDYQAALALLTETEQDCEHRGAEEAYLNAYCYHRLGFLSQAEACYSQALTRGYDEFWVKYNRGALYLEMGDRVRSYEDLSRARELNPQHPGVNWYLQKLGASPEGEP
jgi:hypothetical protein